MVRFDLKVLSFMIFLWGILNLMNGIIIFNHEIFGSLGKYYYYLIGGIRILIGIVTLVIFWYVWRCADKIAIFERKDI